MYAPVQTLGTLSSVHPSWNEFDLPAVVEDDDGIRLLVTSEILPEPAWEQARMLGVAGVLRVGHDRFDFAPVEVYDTYKTVNRFARAYDLADRYWVRVAWGIDWTSANLQWNLRNQDADNRFVHLHTHSEFSALDGYSRMDEIGDAVVADGQSAIGIADHGNCAGHPALQKMANERNLHPVFGMEANFVNDRLVKENPGDYQHLVVWAKDQQGLKNLWSLSTEGYRDGFYGRPRVDWDSLQRHREGLIVSTACLRGPLAHPLLQGHPETALQNLARLGEIFDQDLWIELHVNRLPDQVKVNEWLIDVSAKYGVPLVASVDSHYAHAHQKRDHKIWLAMQTNKDLSEDSDLFAGDQEYHLMTLAEVRKSLSYLPDAIVDGAIESTALIAESTTAEIQPQVVKPVYSRPTAEHPDPKKHDIERFLDMCESNWDNRITRRIPAAEQEPYFDAYEFQTLLLVDKEFPGYYLITADFVNWAKSQGILVGPGRGSGGASLHAYLMRITEIDPIEANLLFARFMTEGRTSLPDFDIDFPSNRTDEVIAYVQQRWGHEHVARVGSHIRIKNRGAFADTQRVLAPELPPESFQWKTGIAKLIEAAEASTAGLGLSWDDLMAQIGELLEPFKLKMPELFRVAEEFHLRLKTYGKHAAGIIIDPDNNLEAELPMRRGETDDAPMVTQWDMEALEFVGKVKFDFLSLRNLDTIQETLDLIKTDTGIVVNPYDWTHEYVDPQVFEELSDGWTLGVFQIETPLGTRVTRQLKPKHRADLTNIITIGRPGPLRSGLDKLYMGRRDGKLQVSYPDPRMEKVLSDTYGVMLYQEDIMGLCIELAGYQSDEADAVRKILGKKQVEKVAAAGQKFVDRAVANGTDRQVAVDLWEQMAEFAKYSFNRAHAHAYATIGCWTAWLKTHYPRQALTASMMTIKKERVPQFVNETRRLGYSVLPPDINLSKQGFTSHELEIRYGFEAVPGIGESASLAIIEGQPYEDYDDFIERKGSAANMGVVKKLVAIGAFDSIYPNRRALEAQIIDITTGVSDKCVNWDPEHQNLYNALPCHFDWDSEPKQLGRTGKVLKTQKKPPTKCTRACRQYVKKPPTDYSGLPNYTAEEIRNREVEMLGVFLSSSPFDVIPNELMTDLYTADDLAIMENGEYPIVASVISARPDPKGRDFGFSTLLTPSGELSVIVFSREWDRFRPVLKRGQMVLAAVLKTADDRYRLTKLEML